MNASFVQLYMIWRIDPPVVLMAKALSLCRRGSEFNISIWTQHCEKKWEAMIRSESGHEKWKKL